MDVPGLDHQSHDQEYTRRLEELKGIVEFFLTKMFLFGVAGMHFCKKNKGPSFCGGISLE